MTKRTRADLALAFAALIWGATFVIVKDALLDISALLYLAARFGLATVVLGVLCGRSLRRLNHRSMWAGAQIAFFMFGGYVFQTVGLKFTTPSKAAFITGSSVVLVPIFLATFGRLHFNLWTWAGASTALAGLYFVTVPVEGLSGMNLGDPLVVGCAVMFALHIIFVGRYAQLFPVSVLSFLQIAATAAFSLVAVPLAAVAGWEHPHLTLTGGLIFAVLVTAIGSTVIAFSLQVWAQQNTSASHTALLLSLEPVAAALTSWLLGSEHFGRRILLGAALILFGILLAELKGLTAVAPESPEPAARSPR